jgi:hypothetical protein
MSFMINHLTPTLSSKERELAFSCEEKVARR